MKRNTGSQKWRVFAFYSNTNAPLAGDAAQIVGRLSKDFAAEEATNDANPTDITNGYYEFDLTQAETNAHTLQLRPYSSTTNCVVLACPSVITTIPWESTSDLPNTNIGAIATNITAPVNLNTACANYSVTRGLAGTALPAAAADGAGGLPISDAGGLDLDAVLSGNIPQSGDSYAITNNATYGNAHLVRSHTPANPLEVGEDWSAQVDYSAITSAVSLALSSSHGAGSWATATGFLTSGQTTTAVTNALNTAIPSSPTANSTFHYLKIVDAVVLGTTNVSGSQVQFRDRSNTVATTITYSATDGGRDTVVIV